MGLKGCFQPDGRDEETGSRMVGSPPLKTRRAHAPRRNTPLCGRPHFVGVECFMPDIHIRPGGSEKIVLQQFSGCFLVQKKRLSAFQEQVTNHQIGTHFLELEVKHMATLTLYLVSAMGPDTKYGGF